MGSDCAPSPTACRDHRLAGIAIMLASAERLRASDLAKSFGVSERTIYRDMQALTERGFPVAAIPGPRGGFALFVAAGNRNVNLRLDEALALLFCCTAGRRDVHGEPDGAIDRALGKVLAILPPDIAGAVPVLLDAPIGPLASSGAGGSRHRPN